MDSLVKNDANVFATILVYSTFSRKGEWYARNFTLKLCLKEGMSCVLPNFNASILELDT